MTLKYILNGFLVICIAPLNAAPVTNEPEECEPDYIYCDYCNDDHQSDYSFLSFDISDLLCNLLCTDDSVEETTPSKKVIEKDEVTESSENKKEEKENKPKQEQNENLSAHKEEKKDPPEKVEVPKQEKL